MNFQSLRLASFRTAIAAFIFLGFPSALLVAQEGANERPGATDASKPSTMPLTLRKGERYEYKVEQTTRADGEETRQGWTYGLEVLD
ncbi:MAG: hypothetical protein KDC38_02185, partial [Planctomycetes bacterium]|nr:hypothetical protein [Planctomycetota bacterium]